MKKNITRVLVCLYICFTTVALGAGARPKIEQELNAFLKGYVDATNTHDFTNVQPLLLPAAVYWFNKR